MHKGMFSRTDYPFPVWILLYRKCSWLLLWVFPPFSTGLSVQDVVCYVRKDVLREALKLCICLASVLAKLVVTLYCTIFFKRLFCSIQNFNFHLQNPFSQPVLRPFSDVDVLYFITALFQRLHFGRVWNDLCYSFIKHFVMRVTLCM